MITVSNDNVPSPEGEDRDEHEAAQAREREQYKRDLDKLIEELKERVSKRVQAGKDQQETLASRGPEKARPQSHAVHPRPGIPERTASEIVQLEKTARNIQEQHGVSLPMGQILAARGLSEGKEVSSFLKPTLEPHVKRIPSLLGVKEARSEIVRAISKEKPITIVCDYDADGTTSAAILTRFLRDVGVKNLKVLSPDRNREGHGLNDERVQQAAKRGKDGLLIVLDFGTKNHGELALAKELGLRTLVIDHHHQPEGEALPADAFINPQRPECGFHKDDMCTAGLTWLVTHAVRNKLMRGSDENLAERAKATRMRPLLALAALGTVADVVPLTPSNRALVTAGLKEMNRTPIKGLKELMALSGVRSPVSAEDLGFAIAPRLNALTRMIAAPRRGKTAGMLMTDLLSTPVRKRAREFAELADERNRRRKELERLVTHKVVKSLEAKPFVPNVIFVADQEFKGAVHGIIAARLVDRYARPAFVMTRDGEGNYVGSARSGSGVHLAKIIEQCGDIITKGGGHAAAAGFTLPEENLLTFKNRVRSAVKKSLGTSGIVAPTVNADIVLTIPELLANGASFVKELKLLEPCGRANPSPKVALEGLSVATIERIDNRHLKVWFRQGNGHMYGMLWNHRRHPALNIGGKVDIVAKPFLEKRNAIHNAEKQSLRLEVLAVRATTERNREK